MITAVQTTGQTSDQSSDQTLRPPSRKLSDMLTQEIEPMSPFKMDFPDSNFGRSGDVKTTEEPSMHSQATNSVLSSSAGNAAMKEQLHKLVENQLSYREQERGSWVNIKLVKDGSMSSDSGSVNDSWKGEKGGGVDGIKAENNMMGGSLDRVST